MQLNEKQNKTKVMILVLDKKEDDKKKKEEILDSGIKIRTPCPCVTMTWQCIVH